MKKSILSLIFFLAFSAVHPQLLRQPISNFTPSEYGQMYSSYTFAVAEDDNGMIYLGTVGGILQYDGALWRSVHVKAGSYVTSLSVHNNIVYVGAPGEFGFLKANEFGLLQYHSLSDRLPENEKNFSRIWETFAWRQSVIFQAEEKIFILNNDSLTIVKPESSFHTAFVEGGDFFVRERERGLLQFDGRKFNMVHGGEFFANLGIFAILPLEGNRLIVTQEKGLWKWDGVKFTRIPQLKELDFKLTNSEVIGGIALYDGNYALNTLKNGIIILDSSLNLVAEYTDNSGMLSSEIFDIIQDKQGNLWSATQRGASRLLYPSAFSYFNQSSGLFGLVQAIGKMGNDLLVGTSVGLFVNHTMGMKTFEEVSATKGCGSVWAIEESPDGMWIGTENGLWLFDGKSYSRINQLHTSSLKYIPEKNWLVAAGMNGLQIIDAANKNVLINQNDIKGDLYGLAYTYSKQSQKCEIWIGTKTSGVWQLKVNPNLSYSFDFFFGSDDGILAEWISPYQAGNSVVFASSEGMYRFVSSETMHSLLNDTTDNISEIRGYFDYGNFPKESFMKAVTAFHFNEVESYAAMDYFVYSISMKDSIPRNRNYKTLQLGRFNSIKKWDNVIYIGGDGGLAVVDQKKFEDTTSIVPHLLIRQITMGYDSVLWYGDIPLGEQYFEIPYSANSLAIDLSSSYHENGYGAQFSWMFKGIDQGYARWTTQNEIQLSNLREGDYELLIVAKNIHDELGNELKLNFKVLPPWYRTWWAIAIYVAISILAVYALIQLNIRRLKAQNKKLEEIVRQRTKQVVEQKDHIEHILEDIRSSISYAQRIQQALLPSQEFLKECLPNHFILFFPRDVVSGDFYWAGRVNNWLVVTVVDCTGHGVPGAFMSMLGISFLHEIVRKHEETSAAKILNELRKAVIEALKQTGKQNEQKDGMDMSLLAIDLESMKCQWAGANNSLYLVRKNESSQRNAINLDEKKYKVFNYDSCVLHEVKADKMPVAIHAVMDSYTNHEIDLIPGDRLYMFTDGFADQFGGTDCRKFMAKSFKELIAKTSSFPIKQQAKEMEKAFKGWKCMGDEPYEQIDDVTVMGIEV